MRAPSLLPVPVLNPGQEEEASLNFPPKSVEVFSNNKFLKLKLKNCCIDKGFLTVVEHKYLGSF